MNTLTPLVYKRTGIVIAALIGSSFASAILVRQNFRELGREREANEAMVVFGCLGLAFILVASRTPDDLVSILLSVSIPELLLVWVLLRFTRLGSFTDVARDSVEARSNWDAAIIAAAVNLGLKTIMWAMYFVVA